MSHIYEFKDLESEAWHRASGMGSSSPDLKRKENVREYLDGKFELEKFESEKADL